MLHSYAGGWRGPRTILDPPVDGAIEFLFALTRELEVAVYSSRSGYWGGRRAMKRWLRERAIEHLTAVSNDPGADATSQALRKALNTAGGGYEPWDIVIRDTAAALVSLIQWPVYKPPAAVTLDDRALTFDGTWPDLETIFNFKPWTARDGLHWMG